MKTKFGLLVLIVGIGATAWWLCRNFVGVDFGFARVREESSNQKLPALEKPHIVVNKSKRELQLFDNDRLIKTYTVALGFAPVGNKERMGDGRTPEGDFYIAVKNSKSKFYLSLGLSYPGVEDAARGLREEVISQTQHDQIVEAIKNQKLPPQHTALGGEIYIHGGGAGNDWTWGCVALENADIKALFDALPLLTKVTIEP